MKSSEIIDATIGAVNVAIARRKTTIEKTQKMASQIRDAEMYRTCEAQLKLLERIEKDLIQVEMNAKISYMGINTD